MNDQNELNYQNYKSENQRNLFSSKIRSAGIDHIPIVVDSTDKKLALAISTIKSNTIFEKYALEISLHSDSNFLDLINIIKEKMLKNNNYIPFDIYLENDMYPIHENSIVDFGFLYKKYRNQSDNILYFIIKPQLSFFNKSILYLKTLYVNYFQFKH